MTAPIFVEQPLVDGLREKGRTIIVNAALVTAITAGTEPGQCYVTVAQLGSGIVHAQVAGSQRAVALALSMGNQDQPTFWTAAQLAEVGL